MSWRRVVRKTLAAAAVAGMAGACMLPLPISIASTAIDVVLTIATGKSKSDYLLSFVMQQDCALFRIIEGEEICVAEPQEIPSAIPDGLYARIVDPETGESGVGRVIRAQPVYSYAEMPQGGPTGAPMQPIEQTLPAGKTPRHAIAAEAHPGGEIPMRLPQ